MRLFFLILLFLNINLAADEYNFGEGINIPHTPIYVGGYATLDYVSRADNYNRFRVDELSILSYGSSDRFSYMADFGLRDSYMKEWGSDESSTTDNTISIERLYIDYQVNDSIRVRAGKFNTPAGYWNMEPINIFRETSSIPYTAFLVFPRFTSGLEVKYANSLYSDTEYSVVIQHNEDIDDTYNNIAIDKHYLASIEHFFSDSLKSKANIGYFFSTVDNRDYYYALLALSYEAPKYKILAEAGSRRNETEFSVPYSFYLQGSWHLTQEHDLVTRIEAYKIDEGAFREEVVGVLGYTYRPVSPFTFKIEYRDHSYQNENQIRTSVSVMF